MAQLSRPYQIGLAAVAVLAAAWLLLIQGHGGASGSGSTAPSAQVSSTPAHTVTAPAAPAKPAEGNAGSATGTGSGASLGSLGTAIAKARGAVAISKEDEKRLGERSAQASSESTASSSGKAAESTAAPSKTASATSTSVAAVKSVTPAKAAAPAKADPVKKAKAVVPGAAHRSTATVQQYKVEAQLAQGKVAVILFWDPKGAEDRMVHSALRSLRGDASLKIAIDEASAAQVASFGSITRGVQVYGTPTLLFVNKQGKVLTLTGLQDSFAIAQSVREARHA